MRVPIRHIDSCQIHILDMVIGSMFSRASSASQSYCSDFHGNSCLDTKTMSKSCISIDKHGSSAGISICDLYHKYHPVLIPTLIRTRFQTSPENFFYSKNQYQRRSTCLKPVESGTGFLIDKLTRNLRNLILLCQRGSISLLETI